MNLNDVPQANMDYLKTFYQLIPKKKYLSFNI